METEPLAEGDVIYFEKIPDMLYGLIMVYGKNDHYFGGLHKSNAYYFQIKAFTSTGIGCRSEIKKAL